MRKMDLLSARTSITPYIPRSQACLFPNLLDLRACNALIISIVPFPDILCYLNIGFSPNILVAVWPFVLPGEFNSAAKVEKLEGFLSAFSGRNVTILI